MAWKNTSLHVGFYLAVREIRRSNPYTHALIIFLMTLTFFNMVLVSGTLGGLAEGVIGSFRLYYSADILVKPSDNKAVISQTAVANEVIRSLPSFKAETIRYIAPVTVEYGYKKKIRSSDMSERVNASIVGINPEAEDKVTQLSKKIVAGSYLTSTDVDVILIGSDLLRKYQTARGAANATGAQILKNVEVGSRVRITVNGMQKEVVVKGIISTTNSTADARIYMPQSQARQLIGRNSLNANEIAVRLTEGAPEQQAKEYILKNLPKNHEIIVQTPEEALPPAITQITDIFAVIANAVGGIGLAVGAITIFIVIYINAITRKKYIGILKGIGISPQAIETSYVIQALFYATAGIFIASIIVLGFLVPYFRIHLITYPAGQGTLAVSVQDVVVRAIILSATSIIAGFIPVWLVTKQNTLDAIIGR